MKHLEGIPKLRLEQVISALRRMMNHIDKTGEGRPDGEPEKIETLTSPVLFQIIDGKKVQVEKRIYLAKGSPAEVTSEFNVIYEAIMNQFEDQWDSESGTFETLVSDEPTELNAEYLTSEVINIKIRQGLEKMNSWNILPSSALNIAFYRPSA